MTDLVANLSGLLWRAYVTSPIRERVLASRVYIDGLPFKKKTRHYLDIAVYGLLYILGVACLAPMAYGMMHGSMLGLIVLPAVVYIGLIAAEWERSELK